MQAGPRDRAEAGREVLVLPGFLRVDGEGYVRLEAEWGMTAASFPEKHFQDYGEITAATLRVLVRDVVRWGEPDEIWVLHSDPTVPALVSRKGE